MSTIAIVGSSGSGKSTSLRNLDPKTTYIIQASSKALPFPGWKKKYKSEGPVEERNLAVCTTISKVIEIIKVINKDEKRKHVKTIVIDDSQFLFADDIMSRAKETGFGKFTDLAVLYRQLINCMTDPSLRTNIVYITHSEIEEDREFNKKMIIKTHSKFTKKILGDIEGYFTYVICAVNRINDETKQMEYLFLAKDDGIHLAKTPMGYFEEMVEFDNDVQLILNEIERVDNGENE